MQVFMSKIFRSNVMPVKFLYFFVKLQIFSFYHFRGPFAAQLFQIKRSVWGKYMGTILSMCFFTNMGIATINDKFKRPRALLVTLLLLSTVSFECFFLISKQNHFLFWAIMTMYLIFETGVTPLLDHHCVEYLNNTPGTSPNAYGRQRLWGAIAFSFGNFIIEYLCRKEGDGSMNFYPLRFYVPIVAIPAIFVTYTIVRHYPAILDSGSKSASISEKNDENSQSIEVKDKKEKKTKADYHIFDQWVELAKNKEFLFFAFIILLNGITRTALSLYLGIYQTEVLNLRGYKISGDLPVFFKNFINIFNKNAVSTTTACGTLVEVLFLFLSLNINSKLGLYWPLLIAQVAQLFRNIGYCILPYNSKNVFAVSCLLETCKGINFALTHSSGVQIANLIAPNHLKSTCQMIYGGVFFSLASFISGQTFGRIFEKNLKNNENMEMKVKSFKTFFSVNLCINMIFLTLFIVKYGIFDGKLPLKAFLRKKSNQSDIQNKSVMIKID